MLTPDAVEACNKSDRRENKKARQSTQKRQRQAVRNACAAGVIREPAAAGRRERHCCSPDNSSAAEKNAVVNALRVVAWQKQGPANVAAPAVWKPNLSPRRLIRSCRVAAFKPPAVQPGTGREGAGVHAPATSQPCGSIYKMVARRAAAASRRAELNAQRRCCRLLPAPRARRSTASFRLSTEMK